MKRTLVSFNWAMQGILREKANFDILSGFFSELLGRKVEVQDLLESESNPDSPDDKTNRLDIKAKIDDGEIVIFELQVGDQNDFFHRILYGSSKAVAEQLHKGDDYGKIRKVYSVVIVYFELGKGSDYIYHGVTDFKGVHNNETLLLSKKEITYLPHPTEREYSAGVLFPEYYIIYPERFDGRIDNKFDEWVSVFKNSEVESTFTAAGIQEAGEALDLRKMNEWERVNYEAFMKVVRVRNSEINTALWKGEQNGLADGERKGRAEALTEVAKNLKSGGMGVNDIAKATGLTADEILRI
jgi:hypothetical protein